MDYRYSNLKISVVTALLMGLYGCGSSGGGEGTEVPLPSSSPPPSATPSPKPTPPSGVDPLWAEQWYLQNVGQGLGATEGGSPGEDLHISDVWQNYRGNKDIAIAIIDVGMEIAHPDLKGNFDLNMSYNYVDDSNDPSPRNSGTAHGTCVSGIVGAKGWNGIGGRGIVPNAKMVGLNAISVPTIANLVDALGRNEIDILSNSWGVSDGLIRFDSLIDTIQEGCQKGRKGKGSIYVFAAGNDRNGKLDGNANFSDLTNNRYALCIAAVNADGKYASYSNMGASIWVAGMGGEYGKKKPAIVTTDLTGLDRGWDTERRHFDVAGNENGDYTNIMNGTSAACPMVSGTVALMLEANPKLSWRDIRYILATTSRKNDSDNSEWVRNGAGRWVNYNYGFGVVDVYKAVMTAKDFEGLADEETYTYSDTTIHKIPKDRSEMKTSLYANSNIAIEYIDVFVTIDADTTHVGNLEIILTSPSGTESVLAWGNISLYGEYDNWRFGTARHLDEMSQGNWKLSIRDTDGRDKYELKEWKLKIYGHKGE